jgi:hypothetical protein
MRSTKSAVYVEVSRALRCYFKLAFNALRLALAAVTIRLRLIRLHLTRLRLVRLTLPGLLPLLGSSQFVEFT